MSLEKAIKKLTQVIQAQTPPGPNRGVPDGSPIGREVTPRDPCETQYYPGEPAYCYCYKRANTDFAGTCCYESSNNNCYCLTYKKGVMNPIRNPVTCDPKEFGIEDGPSFSPTTPVRN